MKGDDLEEYAAVVGPRWERYRPRFARFARGERVSWNWAAFFATFGWLRYRRMYAASWLYFFVSTPVLLIALRIERGGDTCEKALDPAIGTSMTVTFLAVIATGWIVPPLFADRLYYNHLQAPGSAGGVARAAPWAALILQAMLVLLAAGTISSYGSYRYRSMVAEGLNVAGAAKAALAEYEERHGRMPSRIEDLGMGTAGQRVERLVLDPDGTITATFGAGGDKLAGRSVSFTPVRKQGRIVEWTCRSDLPDRCLPQSCRRTR